MRDLGVRAREASRLLARSSGAAREAALRAVAAGLERNAAVILLANTDDVAHAREAALDEAFVDRLRVDEARLRKIAAGVAAVADLGDPVGEVFDSTVLPNGLRAHKQRVPLGVLGVVYESRPDVTAEVASLAIRSGNAVLLRGGRESLGTNDAIATVVRAALEGAGLPADAVQYVDDPDRSRLLEMLQLPDCVDAVIPRGGERLQAFCAEHSRVPVIYGGIGICHLYVEPSADFAAALGVVRNAKVQRPTVCNALDTLLVHHGAAAEFLPRVIAALVADGVRFRAHPSALPFVAAADGSLSAGVEPAGERDFDTEWLSLTLGLRVVDSFDEAVAHIARHGSAHSDGILTGDPASADRFVAEVDSAAVFVNASTRFNDGGQLGLGAEAAVSTQRMHVRGPMGLRELTTYKWVVRGDYHSRA